MTTEDFEQFGEGLTTLAEVFDKPITPALIQIYFAALADLDAQTVTAAMMVAAGELKFFPKPIELRELISGTAADQGQQAWESFLTAVKRFGGYTSVKFEDAAIADAVLATFGGWIEAATKLPQSEDPMFANYRKNFAAAYELARKRPNRHTPYLPGIAEAQNRNSGLIGGEFTQRVGLISHDGQTRGEQVTFDQQGRLTAASRHLLGLGDIEQGSDTQGAMTAIGGTLRLLKGVA